MGGWEASESGRREGGREKESEYSTRVCARVRGQGRGRRGGGS